MWVQRAVTLDARPSLMIPVSGGRPALGRWQGIYLLEHRDHGGARRLVVTAWGEPA